MTESEVHEIFTSFRDCPQPSRVPPVYEASQQMIPRHSVTCYHLPRRLSDPRSMGRQRHHAVPLTTLDVGWVDLPAFGVSQERLSLADGHIGL